MYGRYTTTHINRRRVVQKKNQTLTKYVSKARSGQDLEKIGKVDRPFSVKSSGQTSVELQT